jgi:hypothetical protein
VIKQDRAISGFTSIDASGSGDVYVSQDSVFSVKVEIDSNLQEYMEVYKEGSELHIHQKNNTSLDPTGKIKIYISGPSFTAISVSGACDVIGQNTLTSAEAVNFDLSGSCDVNMTIIAPKIKVSASGAGSVSLKGQTKDFSVEGSGSTDIRCFELLSENTKVDISGAGNAEVFASVKLNVGVSGSADVKYKGNASVSQDISGAGSIRKVE